MAPKTYSLTKVESTRLENILNVARIQEEMFNSITLAYKDYLVSEVFKRCGVDPKDFLNSVVNLQSGELVINEPPKAPEVPAEKGKP